MTQAAFVDAPAGCAGDMFLGALLDLGLPLAVLEEAVDGMGLTEVELRVTRVRRGAFAATRLQVCAQGKPVEGPADGHLHAPGREHPLGAHEHGHRSLSELLAFVGRLGDMQKAPLAQARGAFEALADAEARVHGERPGAVRFHEVGSIDALVDVVGTCVGFHHLGVETVRVSPLPWGRGTVESTHGLLPLPAPATVHLLEGHPTVPSRETHEQVTPTGAALVRVLSRGSEVPAGFVPRRVGCGAGTFEGGALPNVLRIVLGEVGGRPRGAASAEEAVHLTTNLDDVSGQVAARAMERALADGALDAWWAPITMKKGRPGVVLSILAHPVDAARMEALLFRETPTLGVRRRRVERTVLARRHESVETPWGSVRVKVREAPDGPEGTPEYEDCRRLADAHGIPVRRVLDAAARVWASP